MTGQPPIQQQVPFKYDLFTSQFPNLTTLTPPQALMYWTMATRFHRNDGGGPITNNDEQELMLNLLTAHIATLLAPDASGEIRGVVGRLSSFSEGSASGAVEFQGPQEAAWYLQTPYGATYWELTSSQRTMFYRSAPRRRFDAYLPFPFIPW
jgi:hypothetical protein